MALKDITIQFSATGDDVLIQTIKALDIATQSLIKAQTKLAGEGKKKISVDKANLNSLRKLNVELKLQGKNLKAVKINTDLYKQALKGNRLAMGKIRLATAKYTASLKKMNVGMFSSATSGRLLNNTFATLRSKMLITAFAITLVEKTVISLVKSFAQQEAVNIKLRAGLANISVTTDGVTQRLIDYSSALQQTTAFGDELITNGMAQLTTFGLNEEAIKALTPQVLNVARAIQTTSGTMPDLNSLFIAFGKSTSTAVSALTRYGVVLTDTEKKQLGAMEANKRAGAIAEILNKQYGGLAEAYAKTTLGMLEAAAAARGDAAEAFGEVLAPAVLAVSEALKVVFEAATLQNIKIFGTAAGVAAVGMGALAVAAWASAAGLTSFSAMLLAAQAALVAFDATAVVSTGGIWAIGIALGVTAGALLKFFGAYETGEKVLTDSVKKTNEFEKAIRDKGEALGWSSSRILLEIEAMKKRMATEAELKVQQDAGELSLQKRLLLLEAKTDFEKELIKLGHEASAEELKLIQQIVDKNQAIADEKRVREASLESYKKYLEAMRDEVNLRTSMNQKIELAHLDLLKKKLEGMSLDGKLTESNSEKLSQYIDFQKQLISTFGVGIHTTKKLTSAGIANGITLDMQSMNVEKLSKKEKELLQVMIDIFNQRQRNIVQAKEAADQAKEELTTIEIFQLLNSQATAAAGAYSSFVQGTVTADINALKARDSYQNASMEKRAIMEEGVRKKHEKALKRAALLEKAQSIASATIGTYNAVVSALGAKPWTPANYALAAIVGGLGAIQVAAIAATPTAYAKGGDFVTNKPELIMVGEAGREHVRITPLDRPEERALTDGGITVNIMGGIVQEDYVTNELLPAINKARALA